MVGSFAAKNEGLKFMEEIKQKVFPPFPESGKGSLNSNPKT